MLRKKLLALMLVSALYADISEVEMQHEVKGRSCKTFRNVNVCNNLSVGGNETVTGSITANSFINSLGAVVNGFRTYALLTNQAEIAESTAGNPVLWDATYSGNLSPAISVDTTSGLITLPTGTFFVEYSVRLDRFPPYLYPGTSLAKVQLQQTSGGILADITQPAVVNNAFADVGDELPVPVSERQVTGYALITVTSASNNVLDLVVTVTQNATIPAATGTDANAQMVILQLN